MFAADAGTFLADFGQAVSWAPAAGGATVAGLMLFDEPDEVLDGDTLSRQYLATFETAAWPGLKRSEVLVTGGVSYRLRTDPRRLDAVLKASVPVGTNVWRDRTDAESLAEAPGVNVLAREGAVEAYSSDMDLHQVFVELRFYVRAEPGVPAAEALHSAVHGPVVTDAALAALCESRRLTEYSFDRAEADTAVTHKPVRYRFTYLIPQTTL